MQIRRFEMHLISRQLIFAGRTLAFIERVSVDMLWLITEGGKPLDCATLTTITR